MKLLKLKGDLLLKIVITYVAGTNAISNILSFNSKSRITIFRFVGTTSLTIPGIMSLKKSLRIMKAVLYFV